MTTEQTLSYVSRNMVADQPSSFTDGYAALLVLQYGQTQDAGLLDQAMAVLRAPSHAVEAIEVLGDLPFRVASVVTSILNGQDKTEALEALMAHAGGGKAPATPSAPDAAPRKRAARKKPEPVAVDPAADEPVTLVAGKSGADKSNSSGHTAVEPAAPAAPVAVVETEPAAPAAPVAVVETEPAAVVAPAVVFAPEPAPDAEPAPEEDDRPPVVQGLNIPASEALAF